MASKTIIADLISFPGETGVVLHLATEAVPNTTLNGSGTACSLVGTSVQSCVVSVSLATYGWLAAIYKNATGDVLAKGPVYIAGEVAGTYVVDGKDAEQRAAQYYAYYQPVVRSVDDDKAITFIWPLSGRSFSGSTRVIDGGSSSVVAGAITELGGVGTQYEYSMAYAVADRPTEEGTVRYTLTDGTNTRYLTLRIERASISTADLAAGATVLSSVAQTGELNPIIIGDDYLASIGRAFEFTIAIPTGYVLATSTCKFGGKSTLDGTQGWLITGTITLVSGEWLLSFDMGKAISGLLSGSYDWSVEVINASTLESTPVISHPTPVQTIPKQTIS